MKKSYLFFLLIIFSIFPCLGCSKAKSDGIYVGYAECELIPNDASSPLYIAGYKQGVEIEGVLDYQKVKSVYINYYGNEIIMMSIDCVGLTSNYVNQIRKKINLNIDINISSTHTHAGIDTMGLWGPIAMDGKNEDFMNLLVSSSVKVAKESIKNQISGYLTYGKIMTDGILDDSRAPYIYDEYMHQLRFIPDDDSISTRMIFYGAHAEALRSENNLLSADFPAYMSNYIKEKANDNTIFFNGAIGGLIMTKVFDKADYTNNVKITGEKLAEYALSINEEKLSGGYLKQETIKFKVELDNTLFLYYKFLGILGNSVSKNIFTNKYYLKTEASVLKISNLTFILIPGEIFPELIYGGSLINPESNRQNPKSILELANEYNIDNVIVIGLCNDEIGYIVPPSDFLINEEYPYLQDRLDSYGENHYEETNSAGPNTAYSLFKALNKAFKRL